jgi:hypothetical protein
MPYRRDCTLGTKLESLRAFRSGYNRQKAQADSPWGTVKLEQTGFDKKGTRLILVQCTVMRNTYFCTHISAKVTEIRYCDSA